MVNPALVQSMALELLRNVDQLCALALRLIKAVRMRSRCFISLDSPNDVVRVERRREIRRDVLQRLRLLLDIRLSRLDGSCTP